MWEVCSVVRVWWPKRLWSPVPFMMPYTELMSDISPLLGPLLSLIWLMLWVRFVTPPISSI